MYTKRSNWKHTALGASAIVLLLGLFASIAYGLFAKSPREYSQRSPDDVVASAVAMVKNGDARLLTHLLKADSDDMRKSLNRLGGLLQDLQSLGKEIQKQFPEEVAEYREKAAAAAKEGKAPAIMAMISGGMGGGRGGVGGAQQAFKPGAEGEMEGAIMDIVAKLLADPFGWIDQNSSRLSTLMVTDDQATITLDGKPVGGLGIPMVRDDDGVWYIALPTGMPPISDIMPKAEQQWMMLNSLVQLLDNTVVELTTDVRNGSLRNLKSIGIKAQEKLVFPAGIWFAAYSADLDARKRVSRGMRGYRERQQAWAQTRKEQPVDGVAEVSPLLLSAMSDVATKEMTPLIRARTAPNFKDMSDAAFEELVQKWMTKADLRITLTAPLGKEQVDPTVKAWKESTKKASGGSGAKPGGK